MDLNTAITQQIAMTCKTDLFYLCKYILGYEKMTSNTHQEVCDYAQSVLPNPPDKVIEGLDPTKNLLLLLLPRGTFKSSVVTIGFTLQFLLNEPNGRVLIDSETYSKAKNFLAEIKGHLEDNPKFREVFKAIHGVYPDGNRKNTSIRWTDGAVDLASRTRKTKEPSISCSGVDKSINGMHYDLIIADDLHSEKNVTNKDQINGVIEHYKLSFSLLEPGKPLIIIGTRWDYNDLYQHILDFEKEDFNILQRSAYNPDGSLFFPEVLSEEELDKIRRRQGTGIFSKQYLNEPVSDENAIFKRDYIVRKKLEEIRGKPINWILSVDPSYEGGYSDFAAFVLAGMDSMRNLYVRYVLRNKMSYSQIIDSMFRIYTDPNFADLKIQKILIETIATQKSIGIELANEQRRRGTWLPVQEIKSRQKSKDERIKGLAPFYEYGHIFHIQECNQIDELEYELLHFPTGKHDDVIDALASIIEVVSPPNHRTNAERREKRVLTYKPRSPITGV